MVYLTIPIFKEVTIEMIMINSSCISPKDIISRKHFAFQLRAVLYISWNTSLNPEKVHICPSFCHIPENTEN